MTLYEAIGLDGAIAVLSLLISFAAFFLAARAIEIARAAANKAGVVETDAGGMEP